MADFLDKIGQFYLQLPTKLPHPLRLNYKTFSNPVHSVALRAFGPFALAIPLNDLCDF
jgi:hypothetical protein